MKTKFLTVGLIAALMVPGVASAQSQREVRESRQDLREEQRDLRDAF